MLRVTYEIVCDGCGFRPDPVVIGLKATASIPPAPPWVTLEDLHLCGDCAVQARKSVLGASGRPWGQL